MKKLACSVAGILAISTRSVFADVCDYTPSSLIGGKATTAVGVGSGATAATGVGMKAAGLYTITHAGSGAAMLGSTAAGASAAGTTGIIAGTAGFLGTVGTVLLSPFVIIPAAVVAGGIAVYEGGCYLASDKAATEDAVEQQDSK